MTPVHPGQSGRAPALPARLRRSHGQEQGTVWNFGWGQMSLQDAGQIAEPAADAQLQPPYLVR